MSQRTRILIAIAILLGIMILVLGVNQMQRNRSGPVISEVVGTLAPGSVPIYYDGRLVAGFAPADLELLEKASFVDASEGKSQDGWLLRDVLLLYLPADTLAPEMRISVSSTSRGKSAELSWAEAAQESNMVMFDLSNRGTLKLVSKLEKLDAREEWVQDADKIEVFKP
jgi:hypothetical protein